MVPCEWMNTFQSYTESKEDEPRKNPGTIENASLLQSHRSNSKRFLVSPSRDTANTTTSTTPGVVSDSTSSSESGGSDAVLVGGGSPSSSEMNNSFVIVQSDAQTFVKNETRTVTSTSEGGEEEGGEEEGVTVDNMDERTKRRLRWSSIKEEELKKREGDSSEKNDNDGNMLNNTLNEQNVLRNDIHHVVNYFCLGDNAWMLLSSKFGFDIDIELSLVWDGDASNSTYGGWGRLRVDGLLSKRGMHVMIPENGIFSYYESFFTSSDDDNQQDEEKDLEDEELVSNDYL